MPSGLSIFPLFLVAATGLTYSTLLVVHWRRGSFLNAFHPFAPLAWTLTITSLIASAAPRLPGSLHRFAEDTFHWFGPLSVLLLLGCAIGVGASAWVGRSGTTRLLTTGILLFFGVETVSGFLNHQYPGAIPIRHAAYLLYLPTLYWICLDERMTSVQLLETCRRICMFIVYGSLVSAATDHRLAYTGLTRRYQAFGIHERLAGITPHPNLLAASAAVGMLLSLQLRRRPRVASVACLLVMILAEARTEAVGLAAALVIYWVFQRGPTGGRSALLAPVALAVATYLAFGSREITNSSNGLTADVSTLDARTHIWHIAIQNFWQHPTLGWGPFAFDKAIVTPFSQTFFLDAHNQFVQALVEGGILGLMAMILVAAGMIRAGWSQRGAPVYPAVMSFALVMSMTEVPFTTQIYGLSFVIVPALLFLAVAVAAAKHEVANNAVEMRALSIFRFVGRQRSRRLGRAGEHEEVLPNGL